MEKLDSIEEGDEEEASPCSVPLTDKEEEETINLWAFGVSLSDEEDEVDSSPYDLKEMVTPSNNTTELFMSSVSIWSSYEFIQTDFLKGLRR